jgi:hypothetical protein
MAGGGSNLEERTATRPSPEPACPPAPPAAAASRLRGEHVLSFAALALVVGGFFLPWMDGSGPFGLRTFSGFDFARLVRNFEITTDSASGAAQVRGTAIALYLVPAAAVNSAVLHVLSGVAGLRGPIVGWTIAAGGAYVIAILAVVLFLSLAPLNDFENAVGLPRWGFAACLGGGLLLAWAGRNELRRVADGSRSN